MGFQPQRAMLLQLLLFLAFGLVVFSSPAYAVTRFISRSVLVYDPTMSATTKYEFSFTYNTTDQPVGSVEFFVCYNPIPTDPCVAPTGFDASNAVLAGQTGETGFSLTQRTSNKLVISRPPATVGSTPSTYTFTGIVNPSEHKPFSIRLSDYSSSDASGTEIDVGSIITGTNDSLTIETQVPPMMYFCVAQQVSLDCTSQTGGNFTDLGTLDPLNTLTTSSQMAVGTNASGGFAITANGPTLEAGTNSINNLSSPRASAPGNSQFGINLVANSVPGIGEDPDGTYTNANPTPNYAIPDQYTYNDGDVVASSPNVALVRRFTVTYIVNVPPDLRAGVYTTTITYICTGRF